MIVIFSTITMLMAIFGLLRQRFAKIPLITQAIVAVWILFIILSFLNFIRICIGISFEIFLLGLCIVSVFALVLQWRSGFSIFQSSHRHQPEEQSSSGKSVPESNFKEMKSWEWMLLAFSLIYFTIIFYNKSPRWGGWDGWAIWTMHAKFLFYEPVFSRMFTNQIMWTHPDYPLMTPSLIAFYWQFLGSLDPAVPYLVSYITGMSLIMLLYSQVRSDSSSSNGLFLLPILCVTPVIYRFAASQYADSTQALFFLLPPILYESYRKEKNKDTTLLALVGFFAGSAAWVKNEGLFYCLLFSALIIYQNRIAFRKIATYIFGAIGPLMVLFFFKSTYAPENDLIQQGVAINLIEKFTDPNRYMIVLYWLFKYLSSDATVIVLLAIFSIVFFRIKMSDALWMVFGMSAVYFFALLTTPYEIGWHVENSINRLAHQVTPLFIWVIFTSVFNRKTGEKICWAEYFKRLLPGMNK